MRWSKKISPALLREKFSRPGTGEKELTGAGARRAFPGAARLAAIGELWGQSPLARRIGNYARLGFRRLRRSASPASLNKDYRRFLHLAQELLYDRSIEKLFFRPTRGYAALSELDIDSPNIAHGHDYHPVHRLSFDWAMSQLPEDAGQFTFIDLGAGRGRALLLASLRPFRKISGVEFARQLHDDACMNIAQFPRSLMKCRNIECLLKDAADFTLPDEKMVIFINNSFDGEMTESVIDKIVSSWKNHPRRIYLIFVNPPGKQKIIAEIMERVNVFRPIYTSHSEKARLQLLSPDEVSIYRSLK
jgi:hypothetical protein